MTNHNQQNLESILIQIGEAVIAMAETVERLAEKVEAIADQTQNQGQQIQHQSYQIFVLSETLQTFMNGQTNSKDKLDKLVNNLQELVDNLKTNS